MNRLVNVYRAGQIESFHSGSIAVVDSRGRLLAFSGDPHQGTYLRSAAKPFQSVPLLQEGGREEFDLSGEEVALTCASHGGEPAHVFTAAAILRKGGFDESDLLCGPQMPFDERVASELRQTGESATVLHNNCSGKHGGMLLATKLIDAPSANYIDARHDLQLQIRQAVADFSGLHPEQIPLGTDGCGVPSFFMSIYRTAFAYVRFAATSLNLAEPRGLPRYAESAREIIDAMTSHPDYVAGGWSMTTPLMQCFESTLLAKEGAEGFYAMAILPPLTNELEERFGLEADEPIGIALKISDGMGIRARDPVILRTLQLLGIKIDDKKPLQRYRAPDITNMTGQVVGRVAAEFDLQYL